MPVVGAFFVAYAAGTAAVGAVIAFNVGVSLVLGAVQRRLTAKRNSPGTPQVNQREVVVHATDAFETFVYGRSWIGGLLVYNNAVAATGGLTNDRMYQVVRFVGHPVTSLSMFKFDDTKLDPSVDSVVWLPTLYTGSGHVQTGAWRGYASSGTQTTAESPTRFRWYDGNQNSADGVAVTEANLDWDVQKIGKRRAYGILEIAQINEESNTDRVFQKGFPQNIQAYVHGKKLYDPRRYALNGDPDFKNLSSGWFGLTGSNPSSGYVIGVTSLQNPILAIFSSQLGAGGRTDQCVTWPSSGGAGNQNIIASDLIKLPVYSGAVATYRANWTVRQSGDMTQPMDVGAYFYTASGDILTTGATGLSGAGGWDSGLLSGTLHVLSGWQSKLVSSTWTDYFANLNAAVASGYSALPSSAAYMRLAMRFAPNSSGGSVQQAQHFALSWQATSRHLIADDSTWEWGNTPTIGIADYLRDEHIGFGRESRIAINASRYAKNTDPTWRKRDSLTSTTYWKTTIQSGGGTPISAIASLTTLPSVAQGIGRRALVLTASGTSPGSGIATVPFPVDPQGNYVISVWAKQTGDRYATAYLQYLDINGAFLGTTQSILAGSVSNVWSLHTIVVGSASGGNFIPGSAHYAALYAQVPTSYGTNAVTNLYLAEFMCQPGTTVKRFLEPYEQIGWASVASASAYCDEIISTPSGSVARFTFNGAGHTGRSYRDNLTDMLSAGNIRLTYTQSGFQMYAGWQAPSITLGPTDFVGQIDIQAAASTDDRYNHVRGTFYDRDQDGKSVPYATVTADEYIARDNSMRLYNDVVLPYTDNWYEAQRVAFAVLDQGDNQLLAKAPIGLRGYGLAAGRQVAISMPNITSWSPKYFMMTGIEYETSHGAVLTLREDFLESYVDPTSADYIPRSFTVANSRAPFVPQVGSVVLTARPDAVQMTWINPSNRVFEWIDIYRNRGVNSFADTGTALVKSTRNNEWVDEFGVNDGRYLWYYWYQTRDFAGNVSSVYPGGISSFFSAPITQTAHDPNYIFLEEFNYQTEAQFQQMWQLMTGNSSATGASFDDQAFDDVGAFSSGSFNFDAGAALTGAQLTFPNSGQQGGQVLQSSGFVWYVSKIRIPFSDRALYKYTIRYQQVNSADSQRSFYAGFTQYRADGLTYIGTNSDVTYGFQLYNTLNGYATNSLGAWEEATGYLRGTMPWPSSGSVTAATKNHASDPARSARAHPLTKYISPMFILNYNGGGSTAAIDMISVERVDDGTNNVGVADPDITDTKNWRAIGNGSVGSSMLLTSLWNSEVFDAGIADYAGFENRSIGNEFGTLRFRNNANRYAHEGFRPDFHTKIGVNSDGFWSPTQQLHYEMRIFAQLKTDVSVNSMNVPGASTNSVYFTLDPCKILYKRDGTIVDISKMGFQEVFTRVHSLPPNVWTMQVVKGEIAVGVDAGSWGSPPFFLSPAVRVSLTANSAYSMTTSADLIIGGVWLNITAGNSGS